MTPDDVVVPADIPSTNRLAWLVVLAGGAGALDALVFTQLGQVFASVVTGNLVLLGIAAAELGASEIRLPALGLGGYLVGILVAAAWCRRPDSTGRVRAGRVRVCLAAEAVLVAAIAIGWGIAGGELTGGWQSVLVPVAAVAMGMQSAALLAGGHGAPTTYLTSTLTGFVSDMVAVRSLDRSAAARLAALVAGAIGGIALHKVAPAWAFALPAVLVAAGAGLAEG
ncbi:YoaK family protein [Nocardia sp. NPDC127526]|uniref:YoaK family protein n=1 Tax=Nocardia sp. NPDC127526 TaxID=3345393 RepID=UPI0036296F8A